MFRFPCAATAFLRFSLFCTILFFASDSLLGQQAGSDQTGCSDPLTRDSAACQNSTANSQYPDQQGTNLQRNANGTIANPQRELRDSQVYTDSAGLQTDRNRERALNQRRKTEPPTDLQRLAQQSTGELLPIFGRDLFDSAAPSTFAPTNQTPAVADHIVGPGDEILVRLTGHDSENAHLTVDRSGSIYIPQVGTVHVAGTRFDELETKLNSELKGTFRNFHLSVSLGQLRSMQILVVGEARQPGTYTVSSLSTTLNVIFVAGGPTPQGSMRHIQVLRGGKTLTEFDLYDLVLRGDKSRDVPLEPNDVIFFPAVKAQAAVAGSVRHPAIYELADKTTVADVLQLAGGLSATASDARASLERIEDRRVRQAMSIKLDEAGRATGLRDGDVLYINPVSNGYEKSVTIRGNLANPGRFPWHEGMKLSDVIPDRMSLLTNDYWRQRNKLGVPAPLFQPLGRDDARNKNDGGNPVGGTANRGADSTNDDAFSGDTATEVLAQQALTSQGASSTDTARALDESQRRPEDIPLNAEASANRSSLADQQQSVVTRNLAQNAKRVDVKIPVPEIDWSYAVIERLDAKTLKSVLLPFNLGRLVEGHDASQDLTLEPGDVVTILSQADIHVARDEQTKFVRLEGEFIGSGIYSVLPNERLEDVVRRAGGLTGKAYLYGATFTRESARIQQQQRLDDYIASLTVSIERSAAVRSASGTNLAGSSSQYAEEQDLIRHLKQMRATGRVVLELTPESTTVENIRNIPLEDGDIFRVPSRPDTVSVVGAVYGQNIYLYNPARRVKDYLQLAGKTNRIADRRHEFLIRADGSIRSRDTTGGFLGNTFDSTAVYPGDTIVVPEKPIKPSALRDFLDYSQLFSQFALGAAAINVIR